MHDGLATVVQGLWRPTCIVDINAQSLRGVERGFVMHVFMQEHQAHEVQGRVVVWRGLQQRQGLRQLRGQLGACGLGVGQWQLPTRALRNQAAVVKRIGVGAQRCAALCTWVGRRAQMHLAETCQPNFLEPANVAQFPQRWVPLRALRHHTLGGRQCGFIPGKSGQGVGSAVEQCLRQRGALGQPNGVAHIAVRIHAQYPEAMQPAPAKPRIVIVTPALAQANNGNWQTAQRWANFMAEVYDVRLTDQWREGDEALMIALHARRSASSIQAWRATPSRKPLLLVLTGTDLYRDIQVDATAQQSLQWADRLVVLNELGLIPLAPALRAKGQVILQSSSSRRRRVKAASRVRAVMVGHLREEKSPQTFMQAAVALARRKDILLDHVGAGLDAELAAQAQATAQLNPQYRWLGALTHTATRSRIHGAHVLVHASRMEGGAHVVIEAITSGTAVLASKIDGNVGLLGPDYSGYFPWGDSAALVTLLEECRRDKAMLPRLQAQCDARAHLFHPQREKQALLALLANLLTPS